MITLDGTRDRTLNELLTDMTLEERARFLAGIDAHGEENRSDVEKWIRNLESEVLA